MNRKLRFYDQYGVEEYYLYDPDRHTFAGWQRTDSGLDRISDIDNWVSPRLGIRFELRDQVFTVIRPDGDRFLTFDEMDMARMVAEHTATQAEQAQQQAEQAQQQAEQVAIQAEQARQQAEQERQASSAQVEQERQRAERLAAQLRALGIEPEVQTANTEGPQALLTTIYFSIHMP